MEKPEQKAIGWVGGPRYPDTEKGFIAEFSARENLAEMLQSCFDIAYTEPFDKRYLDQKIKVWNAMEEGQRGFSGSKTTKFDFKTRHGVLKVFHYSESDAVQIEYAHIKD